MMSPIITLLSTSAVPFQFPAEYPSQKDNVSLAERRRQRGLPSIIVPQTIDFQSSGGSEQGSQHQLDAENQRALMAAVLNEAVKTLEYVVGPEDVQVTSRELPRTSAPTSSTQTSSNLVQAKESSSLRIYNTPRAPPNSPSHETLARSFDFSNIGGDPSSDDEQKPVVSHQQKDDFQGSRLRRTRSMRKRRRKSSFKDPSIQPRVAPKFPQLENSSTTCHDADDEGSDEDIVREVRKKTLVRSPSKHCHKLFSYHHSLNDKGLKFGLELVAETQKLSSESSSSDSDQTDGNTNKMTNWSKVGEELRSIADSFQDSNGGTNLRVEATLTGVVPLDILSLLNMMLPVSIPQSLWSALVSYAAWKMLKRFQ